MGYGSQYAEKRQKMLEIRLQKVYRQAKRDLEAKFFEFTSKKEQASRKKLKLIEEGKLTEKEYREWLIGQAFQEKQWKDKIRDATFILQHSNEEALKIIQKEQMGFCAENANIEAYKIERDFGFSGAVNFSIYDSSTVQRLVGENPELLPPRRVNGKKDRTWNQGVISNSVTQSIIQGESIDKVANRLARDVASTDMKAMMRYARTAMNSARNAGRMESMRRAQDMGIKIKKEWLATHDNKTRDSHRHLDGQQQDLNKPFISDFGEIMFPGDPEAEPGDVYNCRCDMIRIYPDYPLENPDWRKDDEIDGQSYEEWKQGKKKANQEVKQEAVFGSVSGIIAKTNKYNDEAYKISKEMKELDEEYQYLYINSLLTFGTPECDKINKKMNEVQERIEKLREQGVVIKADRDRFLSEVGEKELMKSYGKIKGKHNAAIDAKSVNVITGDYRTQENCGSCVLAFDARRRGIDCKAILSYGTNNGQVETWWQGLKMKHATSHSGQSVREEIREEAKSWGEGARGIVQVYWTQMRGHYFAFEVVNGRCVFFDPQTGVMNADNLFDEAVSGNTMYARIDDKPLTRAAIFGIEARNK